MGVVLPMFHLLPYLDAADNVSLGDTSSRARRRAIELLDQFGLASRARQLPDSMSAGERRRLMVARALMHRPEIVLADEPTSNLDDENASHIRKVLLEETRPSGVLVVVTHEPPSMYDTELCFSLPNG
jgi:putative ABC transport system ATP-binding protein